MLPRISSVVSITLVIMNIFIGWSVLFASDSPRLVKEENKPVSSTIQQNREQLVCTDNPGWTSPALKAQNLLKKQLGQTGLMRFFGDTIPRTGNWNVLTILIDFMDESGQTDPTYFDDLIYSDHVGTVRNYFEAVSYGQLHITTVNLPSSIGWVTTPMNRSYYTDNNNARLREAADYAIEAIDDIVDYSQYDHNQDTVVDAYFVVFAIRGVKSETFGPTQEHTCDGVKIRPCGSIHAEYNINPGDQHFGSFIHEFGHSFFGLTDLYDMGNNSAGLGGWSMMGDSHGFPDAWSHFQMGYLNPTIVSEDMVGQSISCVENTPEAYLLWTKGILGNEYFLVENRQKVGYDQNLPGSGLHIYHVDELVQSNYDEWYPGHTSSGHYKVALEQADGLFQLESNPLQYYHGDPGDPYPGSSYNREFTSTTLPNSKDYSDKDTRVCVKNISDSGPVITADFQVGYVVGKPSIYAIPGRINMDCAVGLITYDTVFVENEGSLTLDVSGITISSNVFTASPVNFSIPSRGIQKVVIAFAPTDNITYNGTLTISSNDVLQPTATIDLHGQGINRPLISVDPVSIAVTLRPCYCKSYALSVGNNGRDVLHWNAGWWSFLPTQSGIDIAILYSLMDDAENYVADVRSKLLATCKFNSVSTIDARSTTPTLEELQAFKSILIFNDGRWPDAINLGNTIASYIESGGGVVSMFHDVAEASNTYGLQGRYDQYRVISSNNTDNNSNQSLGYIYIPLHPIMQGVESFKGGRCSWRPNSSSVINSGGIRIADWKDGLPLVVAMENVGPAHVKRVDLGFFPVSDDYYGDGSGYFWDPSTDGAKIMANSLVYVAGDGNIITVTPTSGTLAIGQTQDLAISFNAEYLALGNYNGAITISGDALNSPQEVAVSIAVTPDAPISGPIEKDMTWNGNIIVDGNVTITHGSTLKIDSGSTVSLALECGITVEPNSKVIANGTQTAPIKFMRDDPEYYWKKISLKGNDNIFSWCVFDGGCPNIEIKSRGSRFLHCTISSSQEMGIVSNYTSDMLTSNFILDNCEVKLNEGVGIWIYHSEPTITNSNIIGNGSVGVSCNYCTIKNFTGNVIESNALNGIYVGPYGDIILGDGNGYYTIPEDLEDMTGGAGRNRIHDNVKIEQPEEKYNYEIYVDNSGRLYAGDRSGSTLQGGFNRISWPLDRCPGKYIYNNAMTGMWECLEQWVIQARFNRWGENGVVGENNFYNNGSVDCEDPLSFDPTESSGAATGSVPSLNISRPGDVGNPATVLTSSIVAKLSEQQSQYSQKQFMVDLKNKMLAIQSKISDAQNSKYRGRLLGELNVLNMLDPDDGAGEMNAINSLLSKYRERLISNQSMDANERLCSEAALINEIEYAFRKMDISSMQDLIVTYGPYVKNNDHRRALLFAELALYERLGDYTKAWKALQTAKAIGPDEQRKKNHVAASYTALEAVLREEAKAAGIVLNEEQGTSVQEQMPRTIDLSQNYPNPFNPTTVISYQLPVTGYVSLKVYDMLGRVVAVLQDGMKEAGYWTATFDASRLSSGVYFSRLTVKPQEGNVVVQVKKMVLMK